MTSELFNYGLKITAIGMGIVFVTLYLMQLLLTALGAVVTATAKESKIAHILIDEPETATEAWVEVPESLPLTSPTPEISFGVMIAISAALAAAMGSRPVNIVNIRRDQVVSSLWQQAGRSGNPERQHN